MSWSVLRLPLGLLGGLALVLAPAAVAAPPVVPAAGVALTVRVHGLNSDRGRVAVALFASAASFPRQERAIQGQLVRIQGRRAQVTFRDLRPGIYAVAVLHDENENARMDFNFLGMPLEGYGFSNDASVFLGPPSFESAAFRLRARPSGVSIKARYFSF